MDEMILVQAGGGRRVVTPRGQVVPDEPFKVNGRDPYWGRALRVGDLVAVDEKTISKNTLTPPATTKKEDKKYD